MALTQSNEVAARATLGILADKRQLTGLLVAPTFSFTADAAAGAGPVVTIMTVPAGFKPLLVGFFTDGLSASAGVGLNIRIGDAGNNQRLMADVDSDLTASSISLTTAALNYEFTVDTPIILTMTAGKTPTAGKQCFGWILGHVRP
jgi:hypothetical protein